MPAESRRSTPDLTSGVTLLGDTVTVTVAASQADLATGAERGDTVVVVPLSFDASPDLVELARRTRVAISGPVAQAHLLALDLVAAGAPADHLIVEAVVVDATDAPSIAQIEEIRSSGLLVGAVLATESDGSDEDEGWEIAMCTRLMAVGVQTIRNLAPARFRRVQGVVEAIREAAS